MQKNTPQEKAAYHSYQEDLAFQKELNILRNDFYYKMIDCKDISLVDFLYKPLDTLSGDAYTARAINEHKTFYLLVDGMGKGLSASLSAMTMTTFVNHLIDKMIEHDSFSLDILIQQSMDYIKPILLDEEVLSVDYIVVDSYFSELSYAKFSMPAFLLQDKNNAVLKINSNNPPLCKWSKNYKIDTCDVGNVNKFLFYSDGLVENSTVRENEPYSNYIEKDFANSFTREEVRENFFSKISKQEDDITFIFINKLELNKDTLMHEKIFEADLESVDAANNWYEDICQNEKSALAFNELFMNAYEHGSLGINAQKKHQLLEEGNYFGSLLEEEKKCKKKITVKLYKIKSYLITQISDEGKGFDTSILSTIFRNSQKFNGRGVFVSRKNTMGIYYNSKGNSVLFLNKV